MKATLAPAVAATLFVKDAKGGFVPLAGPVDLKGATCSTGEGELACALVAVGDSDGDGDPDFQVAPAACIRWLQNLPARTVNAPMAALLTLAEKASPLAAMVPGIGPAVAEGIKDAAIGLKMLMPLARRLT